MKKIELFALNGDYVATVEVPPFQEGKMPQVIMWGTRTFTRKNEDEYLESFAAVSLTESPGLPREPACDDSIPDGAYTRPCMLRKGHSNKHLYEVVTNANAERLRTPVAPAPPVDRSAKTTLHGTPIDKLQEDQAKQPTGMHADYIVLKEEERSKGFARPVRHSYKHVGIAGPKGELRDLTPEEHERYDKYGYVKYEAYKEKDGSSISGRFWTQAQLNSIGKGCGSVTTMGDALAQTYARDPHFYGRTFCCHCNEHLPVGLTGEFVWHGTNERVGT